MDQVTSASTSNFDDAQNGLTAFLSNLSTSWLWPSPNSTWPFSHALVKDQLMSATQGPLYLYPLRTLFSRYFGTSTLMAILAAVYTGFLAWGPMIPYLTSSIEIGERGLHQIMLLNFIGEQPSVQCSRHAIVKTDWKSQHGRGFNLLPPRNPIAFRYKKVWYCLQQKKEYSLAMDTTSSRSPFETNQIIILSCLGRSKEPLLLMLRDAVSRHSEKHADKTMVFSLRVDGQHGGAASWNGGIGHNIRQATSIDMDLETKREYISDVETFLSEETRRWYAERGIPRRRGYLFSGPPGTGKTSFIKATAGLFGLDIYTVSIGESGISELSLSEPFQKLPEKCIVVFEDIDALNLQPRLDLQANGSKESKQSLQSTHISLSGLLNLLDGLNSLEGRILIMTTNRPKSLDEALTRPGRVDMRVEFKRVDSVTAEQLFLRIYAPEIARDEDAFWNPCREEQTSSSQSKKDETTIEGLAKKFSEHIPENRFTTAQLQGFLIPRKNSASQAVAEIGPWISSHEMGSYEE